MYKFIVDVKTYIPVQFSGGRLPLTINFERNMFP